MAVPRALVLPPGGEDGVGHSVQQNQPWKTVPGMGKKYLIFRDKFARNGKSFFKICIFIYLAVPGVLQHSGASIFLAACELLAVTWGILLPQPGTEPMPSAVEARSLNHWIIREVPLNKGFDLHNFARGIPLPRHGSDRLLSLFHLETCSRNWRSSEAVWEGPGHQYGVPTFWARLCSEKLGVFRCLIPLTLFFFFFF